MIDAHASICGDGLVAQFDVDLADRLSICSILAVNVVVAYKMLYK